MLCLGIPQFVVFTILVSNQFVMASQLNQMALMEHGNLVTELTRGQAVADEHRGLIDGVESCVDLSLGDRAKSCGRLIEDHKGSILIERPCQGDLLLFATGEVHTVVFIVPTDVGVDTIGKASNLFAQAHTVLAVQNFNFVIEKYIYDNNNGLWYELHGDNYIPCLVLDKADTRPIGRWGRKYLRHIKERRKVLYSCLLASGKLDSHLAEIDNRATEMLDLLVKQMAKKEGITEQLNAQDQMAWVQRMNKIRNAAEEIIMSELIFT